MDQKVPLQFTSASLLRLMTFVAMLMVLSPLACRTSFELLCMLGVLLCAAALTSDTIPRLAHAGFRVVLSALLAATAVGMVFHSGHVLEGRFEAVPFALVLLCVALATFRLPAFKINGASLTLTAVGCGLLAGLVAWQLFQSSAERYFVNRNMNSWGTTQFNLQEGCVIYRLRSQSLGLAGRSSFEPDILFNMLDLDSLYRPITKHRFVWGCDGIDSLSFQYAVTLRDWQNLQRMHQLEFLDFTGVQLTEQNAKVFQSLQGLSQLVFLGCKLPDGFLKSCKNAEELTILQIVESGPVDLTGLDALASIRILNLRQTKLTADDLARVASLMRLSQLNISGTGVSSAELIAFADCLKASLTQRWGRFNCTVDGTSANAEAIAALIQSGAVSNLDLAHNELSDQQLADLRALDPKVTLTVSAEGQAK